MTVHLARVRRRNTIGVASCVASAASPADAPGDVPLPHSLGPLSLWALGVGYVISGMYFGWNLGLPAGGPYGLLAATLLVTVLYVTFVLA